MHKEISYGIIPLYKKEGKWEACLILHSNGHFWGFPKGHSNVGETPIDTAKRELLEETGLQIANIFKAIPLEERYCFERLGETVDKTALFYLAEVKSQIIQLDHQEALEAKWVPISDLKENISFPEGKKLALELIEIFRNPITSMNL